MNEVRKFWIQHQNTIKEHWPLALIHIILAVYLAYYFTRGTT